MAENIKIIRDTHKVDASSATLGRLACQIAKWLQGKHKLNYTPNLDMGDFVEVSNIRGMKLTGKKTVQKKYYSHSQYQGNLKVRTFKEVFNKNPARILEDAVYTMLPYNKLRNRMVVRLKIKN